MIDDLASTLTANFSGQMSLLMDRIDKLVSRMQSLEARMEAVEDQLKGTTLGVHSPSLSPETEYEGSLADKEVD